MSDLGFIHRFIPARTPGRRPLLLLHGTGGDENDLIPLGERVAPGRALLSPRGQVLEDGMPRFFRRLRESVFDVADLKQRTGDLAAFIARARAAYDLAAPIALGFSNGANIAASLLFSEPRSLAGAALLRAMLPFEPSPRPDLTGMPVLLLSGATDPFMPAASRERLAAVLAECGANLHHDVLPIGHNLTQNDLTITAQWLETIDP
jgi:phospholipase/carboxylesterase